MIKFKKKHFHFSNFSLSKFFLLFFACLLLIGGLATVIFFNNQKHKEKTLFNYSLDYATNNQQFFLECQKEKKSDASNFSCADATKEPNLKKMLIDVNKSSLFLYQKFGNLTAMNLKFKSQTKKTKGILLETNSSKKNTELNNLYYEALTQKGNYLFLGKKGNDLLSLDHEILKNYAQKYQNNPKTNNEYW